MKRFYQVQKGFTLIELIVVISIVALLVSVTIKWPNKLASNTEAVVQQLVTNLRYAQLLALSRDTRMQITFSSTAYTLTDIDANPIDFPANLVEISGHRNTIELPTDMTLIYPSTISILTFDGRGIPYNNALNALTSEETITITHASNSKSITITPETGKIAA